MKKKFNKSGSLLVIAIWLIFFTPLEMNADTVNVRERYENNVTVRFIPSKADTLPKTGETNASYLKIAGLLLLLLTSIGIKENNSKNNE
ncbi:LPXTG-motif protein cell wall anchor domain protein [Enterococcus faecalis 13-SD-W-01]|nr:LPXTG-motif protein cell wall anchor domain protein [Enterococcus faecalis 13-SD-W-01]